jgi:low temperature requirement protein LtrA
MMIRFLQNKTVSREQTGGTWFELFFDLVYVAILVELGNRLSHDLTLSGTLQFVALFVPIWWSWLALVFYTRYFPSDDIGQRLLTVLYMGAMILLAFEIHGVTGETVTYFILSYAATKFILALMYARAWAQFPEYRSLTSHYAALYFLIGLMWITIAVIAPSNYWLWGLAVAADVFAPLFIIWSRRVRNKPQPNQPPLKHHYMLHRFGELTIIVLGEFFIKLITSSSGLELQPFNFYLGACLLLISVSLWWLYFDHTDHVHLAREQTRQAVWVYMHYFLLSAITAYGVVGTKIFAALPGDILSQEKRMLFGIALAIAVLALGIIDWASPEDDGRLSRRPHLNIRIFAALVLLLLALFGGQITVGWLVTLVASVLVVQVGIDIWLRTRKKAVGETAVDAYLAEQQE